MKLSMNWLSDYTDVKDVDIKAYCDRMTDTGSKVEGYETLAEEISGVVCGVRVETVEEDLMREMRYLDKLVDELAKGKPMEKILRV